MDLADYRSFHGTRLAEIIAKGEGSAEEVVACAYQASELLNPHLNALVESFDASDQSPELITIGRSNSPEMGMPAPSDKLLCQQVTG